MSILYLTSIISIVAIICCLIYIVVELKKTKPLNASFALVVAMVFLIQITTETSGVFLIV